MIHGVLPVWKPRGMTSHDVVGRIRRLASQKRVGHTGTLDPEVEGVLPICLGQATRLVEYIQDMPKRYVGSMLLGISTDTEDQTGNVVEDRPLTIPLTREQIDHVFTDFLGEIQQIPPMYSAVKYQGKRLYDLARSGQIIERKPRTVTIYEFSCTDFQDGRYPSVKFEVLCSKGTYVRTLCVDVGRVWNVPAHMTSLTRTQSGCFHLEDCYTFEELEQLAQTQKLYEACIPMGDSVPHFPSMIVSEDEGQRVLDGRSIPMPFSITQSNSLVRIFTESGRFCALYRLGEDGWAKPEKVFRDVD